MRDKKGLLYSLLKSMQNAIFESKKKGSPVI